MNMATKQEKNFIGFPPVPTETWEEKIQQDLKGADYEKKLIWKTGEGFPVRPYYREEDLQNISFLSARPGEFPYVRGKQAKGNDWKIRQDIPVKDIQKANEKALNMLMKGVNSLGFVLDQGKEYNKGDLNTLLKDICLDAIETNFLFGEHSTGVWMNFIEYLNETGRQPADIEGSLDYDPLGYLILSGNFYQDDRQKSFQQAKKLLEASSNMPGFQVITVHGSHFHNAGSSIVQELAFSMAQANEYLSSLTEDGFSIEELATKIRFQLATGTNFFMEIAKIRAARLLWAQLLKAYQLEEENITPAIIHGVSSFWNKSLYNANANMLRTTTEAMAAAIGGAGSFTVIPYNEVYEEANAFTERLARNQQIILKEEAYMDKVADPSGGSYYIENLTNNIAQQAWGLFLKVQGQGGFTAAFSHGFIAGSVAESAANKDQAIARRKTVFVGTNQYPNTEEKLPYKETRNPYTAIRPSEAPLGNPLKPYRGVKAFEELRQKTDNYALENKRPIVFLLTHGKVNTRRARAQFSANLFACAGFDIIDNNGFDTIEHGVEKALEKQADIVVLCSSDDMYPAIAPKAHDLLANKAIIVVAGYPKDSAESLKENGIKHFVHMGSNALETLVSFQEMLGMA